MNQKIIRYFYFALLLALLLVASAAAFSSTDRVIINNEAVTPWNDGWRYFVDGQAGTSPTVSLPHKIDAKKNQTITLENTLPDAYPEGMTVCFRSVNQYVRVSIDGKEIYQFGYDISLPFGKSPGSAWHFIRMQKETMGSRLTLEFTSPYDRNSGMVDSIHYGSKNSNVFYILRENLPAFFVSLIILLVGAALLIVYGFFRRHTNANFLLYLAWFALLAGLWSLAESRMAQFVMNNQYLVAMFSFCTYMLMPIPLLLFVEETHALHKTTLLHLLSRLFVLNFVTLAILQFFHIVDFMESVLVTNLLIIVGVAVMVSIILVEVFKYKNKDMYILGVGTSAFAVLSLMDYIPFYGKVPMHNAFYFRFAVLFYIIVLTYYTVRKLLGMISQNLRTQMLEQLAFVDLLTNLQNRTAFEKAMEPYRADKVLCQSLRIGVFDINNLKLVNDTRGHQAGDHLLLAAVDCLNAVFAEKASIYRIGGDEFAILSHRLTAEELPGMMRRFEEAVAAVPREPSLPLGVAYGIARFDASLDGTADDLYVRADGYMYEKKAQEKLQ